ncbi:MAG: hypothetical protein LIP09_02735 [Bacteroidales bacterium]|nr:hypothetical protein [Bacteroidales bacterium]
MKKNNINTVNFKGYTPIFENCTFGKVNRNLLINPTKGSMKMAGNQWVKFNGIKDNLLLIYAKIPTKDLTKIFYNQVVKVILFIGIIIQNHTEKTVLKILQKNGL